MVRTILSQSKNVWFKSSRECMKFQKLFDNILKEEIDFDKYISKFENGYNKIYNALSNGKILNHNDENLLNSLKDISNELKQEDFSSEKYKILLKAIADYNKIFNLYKTIRGSNGKTVGDCFRQLGAKTTKSSTKTK